MNNKDLASKIAEKLHPQSWLLTTEYHCPCFDRLDDLTEALEEILNQIDESQGMQKP